MSSNHARYVSTEELEATLAYAAYLMLRYGEWIAPLFDRLEAELEARRQAGSSIARAKAVLDRYALAIDEVPGAEFLESNVRPAVA